MKKKDQYISDITEISPKFASLFPNGLPDSLKTLSSNLVASDISNLAESQLQTKEAFSKKWSLSNYESADFKKSLEFQKKWYQASYNQCR